MSDVIQGMVEALQSSTGSLVAYIPNLLLAAVILFIGWWVAKFVSIGVRRGVSGIDRVWPRSSSQSQYGQAAIQITPSRLLAELLFWLILFLFVLLATEVLGLEVLQRSVNSLLAYLPVLAGALLLAIAGIIIAMLARDAVSASCEAAKIGHSAILGRAVQLSILIVVVVIGFDHIGLDTAFLSVVTGILLAAMLGSVGLAFGLGSREQVSNLLAAKRLRERVEVGDCIRMEEVEGRVIDIDLSHIAVDCEHAVYYIPAALFDRKVALLLKKEAVSESR